MKSAGLVIFAIGVPLLLMLVINWAVSGPAPMAPAPREPAVGRPPETQPVYDLQLTTPTNRRPSSPSAGPSYRWPVELAPAAAPRSVPEPVKVQPPPTVPPPAPTSIAVTTTRPAAAASSKPRIADLIEDWLDDWRQRARPEPGSPREAAAEFLVRGDYAQAAKAFDRLLREKPNDANLILGEVMALTRLGRDEDALPLLTALLEREPKNTAARYHDGVTLTRLDRREEAIAAFTQLLDVQPAHGGAMFNLAILQQSLGRNQDAWRTWRKLTEQFPGEWASRPPKTGEVAATQEAGARPVPPEATLSPELVTEAWFHRGEAEMAMSQVKEAQQCFLEVTRATPGDARAWCNLGIARAVLAEYNEAVPALTEALRLEPTLVTAMNQMAYIHAARYRDTGRPEEKLAVLEWCTRSLAVQSQQPNIRELSDAVLQADREPPPEASPDSTKDQ